MMATKKANKAGRAGRAAVARTSKARVAKFSASVDKDLLVHAQQYARAKGMTLAAVVEEGLRKVTGMNKAPVLPPGDVDPQGPAPTAGPGWEQLLAWMEEQQATLTDIRNALGDVAAALPNGMQTPMGARPATGPRIPPL